MPSAENTPVYIKKYIAFYADNQIVQRGKDILQSKAINFVEYVDKTDSWHFTVLGTSRYTVKVSGVKNHDMECSCTCPYDWGKICKHTVAALLYISDSFNKSTPNSSAQYALKPVAFRGGQNSRYQITDYKNITRKWVELNSDTRIFYQAQYYNYGYGISGFEVSKNKVVFNLSGLLNSNVCFEFENGSVYALSEGTEKTAKLRQNEIYCLLQIANSATPDLFDIVFGPRLDAYKQTIFKKYGFPESYPFENHFELEFDPGMGLFAKFKNDSYGLIPIENQETNQLLDFINQKQKTTPLPHSVFKQKEARSLGFVLKKNWGGNSSSYGDDYEEDDDFEKGFDYDHENDENDSGNPIGNPKKSLNEPNALLELVPIIGKPNKAGSELASHIEEYYPQHGHNYQITISDSANELLKLANELTYIKQPNEALQHKKRMMELLVEQPLVYVHTVQANQIKKGNLQKCQLSTEPVEIQFNVIEYNDLIKADCQFKINHAFYSFNKIDKNHSDSHFLLINKTYYLVKDNLTSQYIYSLPTSLKMVKTHKKEFLEKVIIPISKHFDVEFQNELFQTETIELDFHKKQVFLSEVNEFVIITPQVVYDNGVEATLHQTGNIVTGQPDRILIYKRNLELEDDFVAQLADMHPKFADQSNNRMFYLHYTDFTTNMWFYKFFDQLQTNHIEVFGLKELKHFKYSPYKGKISTSIKSGQDWFEVSVQISFGDNTVSLADIKKAVINKQRYIQLKDGSVGILPAEWFHKLEKYFRNGEIKKDKLNISKLRFSIIDELFDEINETEIFAELHDKKKRLETFTEISATKIPKEITAHLRDYQKEGLNWLNFLDSMHWGGILADDMGLGKTLQILTFIQHTVNQKHSTQLVVVPTTLLFNWENELRKFAPKLKAHYHYGPDRNQNTELFGEHHIVFTTYGILLRDIEFISKFTFNYVFLDESQAIKNPASRRYKAANLISAKNRVALTGTPIENNTFDLFAQMNFVNRGIFGSPQVFKENYSNPIDKEGNEAIAVELHRLTHPFILRRTKEHVAKELPPKTDDIIYCEMEPEQRKVYDAYRNSYRNKLLNKIEGEGLEKSKLMVLEALTRLRQICDSPVLLNDDSIPEKQSVKVKEIIRHITEKTANHKILVFSQFVKMLAIVKDELLNLNIPFEYLDGQCNNVQREKAVTNFQENEGLRVFLISLRAGGTGLNLTAADYVYLLDPWWNPAVENQAIDRCYRIGQDKKVFAYRMICKDTVEEKIMNLQSKKLKIATDIIQTDKNIMKTIDANDIRELFS